MSSKHIVALGVPTHRYGAIVLAVVLAAGLGALAGLSMRAIITPVASTAAAPAR